MCICLHDFTGVEQHITSAHHPQSHSLVEKQKRTINNALVKVLDAHPKEWPHIIEGVLLACRVSRYSSTKPSPFFKSTTDPLLSIDVKLSFAEREVN